MGEYTPIVPLVYPLLLRPVLSQVRFLKYKVNCLILLVCGDKMFVIFYSWANPIRQPTQ